MTGKSKGNQHRYLYTCEAKDMRGLENAIKKEFIRLREQHSNEIYFYNDGLFQDYIDFIEKHIFFQRRIFFIESEKKARVKIIKKTTPSLKDRGTTFKKIMLKAQRVDDDEFYTIYDDVVKELTMYDKKIWKDKVVFCNCDDAVGNGTDTDVNNTSAFPLFFLRHFKELKLKKLICTHYSGQVDLFNQGAKGYIFTKTGFTDIGKKDMPPGYTGSFEDPLSIKILNTETDIVCTNPPFSRAIQYWSLLIRSKKKFIIISNVTNVLNTAFIHYFKDKKVWAGYNEVDVFMNPKQELVRAAGHWYTNFKIKDRPKHKLLKIVKLREIPNDYKKYDDQGTLLVDNGYIPNDYKKPFAVSRSPILNGITEKGYEIVESTRYTPYIDGEEKFARVLIQIEK